MIDIDKYEGHKEGPWCYYHSNQFIETEEGIHLFTNCGDMDDPAYDANSELVADAPLLLEEVKRLREVIAQVWDLMQNSNHEEREMFFWGFDKKNTGWLKEHEELAMKELNWGDEE